MEHDRKQYSALILAAGRSGRMGKPKHSLRFDEHSTFLEEIVRQYRHFGCKQIVVVINKASEPFFHHRRSASLADVVFVINYHQEWERFYSVQLGLKEFSGTSPVFVHNVDNPYASQEVLQSLLDKENFGDFVVPYFKGRGGHPVLLNPQVIRAIIKEKDHHSNLKDFLSDFSKGVAPVADDNVLLNINNEEDYLRFRERRDLT